MNGDPFEVVIAVASGFDHTLALKDDGTVWAWGLNWRGQLGYGEVGVGAYSTRPGQVQGLPSDVVAIASGATHNLALTETGTVWAWGWNTHGQLGDGATSSEPNTVPVQVVDPNDSTGYLTGVKAITAGDAHSIALKDNGTVWTWGWNKYAQLGDGGAKEESSVPVQVVNPSDPTGHLSDVVAIASGVYHALALKDDGTVWAWGHNKHGQLGDGTGGSIGALSNTPVQVAGVGGVGHLTGVRAISAGYSYSLALGNDDTVWAWGSNEEGELGDEEGGSGIGEYVPEKQAWMPGDHRTTPVKVLAEDGGGELEDVLAVGTGFHQSMAVKYDGTVSSWGENGSGEIGDGTRGTNRLIPVKVSNLNVDTSTPTITVSPDGGEYKSGIEVTLEADDTFDPSPTIYYTTDGSTPDNNSLSFDGSGEVSISRTTTLQFYAVDGAAHESAVQTEEYLMAPTAVAQISEEDKTVFVGQSVTLDGTTSNDPDDDPLTYAWTIDSAPPDSESAQLEDADQATATFTPDVWGEYELKLTVDDGRGGTDTDTVTITVQTRPTPAFQFASTNAGSPDQLVVGVPVHFTDESDDPDSQGAKDGWTWSWDFGDGETSSEQHPIHTYGSPGVYHVILQVIDEDGYASETAAHSVLAVGTPGAPVTHYDSWQTDAGPDEVNAMDYGIVLAKDGPGTPLITLAEYGGNPTDLGIFQVNSRFFDVNVYRVDNVEAIQLSASLDTGVNPADIRLYWFNPDDATWVVVQPQAISGDTGTGYAVEVTVDRSTSTPSVEQLTGTIFALGNRVPTSSASIVNGDGHVLIGKPVELDGSASNDPDGDDLTYTWEIKTAPPGDENSTWENESEAKAAFTPSTWGDYVLTLTVDDGRGGTDTAEVAITAQTRPTANFNYESTDDDDPSHLLSGTAVQFIDTSEDPDSEGARDGWTWSWDLGDGKTSTEQNPTHTYGSPGIYHVTLHVMDRDENASESFAHEVLAVGTPGAPVTHYDSWQTVAGHDEVDASIDYGIVLTKDGAGAPLVTLAEYGENPTDVGVFGGSNRFFDINLHPADDVEKLLFTVALGAGVDPTGLMLKWFNPDKGTWELVTRQELTGDDATGYAIEVELDREDSSPTVQQLTGTIFGVGPNNVPDVTLLAPQAGTRWNGDRAIRWEATDPDGAEGQIAIDIEYAPANAGSGAWRAIATGETNDGIYTWDTAQVPRSGEFRVRVTATDELGSTAGVTSDPFFISRAQGVTTGPNPANDHVTFYFGPGVDGTLYVYDAAGAPVWEKDVAAGTTDLRWDLTDQGGRSLANGLYLYRVVGGDGTRTEVGKLVIIR